MKLGMRIAALVCVVAVILPAHPVGAANVATITFTTSAYHAPMGTVLLASQGYGNFSLAGTEMCAGTVGGKQPATGLCALSGAGNTAPGVLGLGGWCEFFGGVVTGHIYVHDAVLSTWTVVAFQLTFTRIGLIVLGTGWASLDGQSGPMTFSGDITPTGDPVTNPYGGSCLNGTAVHYRMIGSAQIAMV